jgi:hypothetical protein
MSNLFLHGSSPVIAQERVWYDKKSTTNEKRGRNKGIFSDTPTTTHPENLSRDAPLCGHALAGSAHSRYVCCMPHAGTRS